MTVSRNLSHNLDLKLAGELVSERNQPVEKPDAGRSGLAKLW